jgi:hypothetical protein
MPNQMYPTYLPLTMRAQRSMSAPPATSVPAGSGRRSRPREEGRSVFSAYDFTDPITLEEFQADRRGCTSTVALSQA